MVTAYSASEPNAPTPLLATVFVISPSTPSGASRITPPVRTIIISKKSSTPSRRRSRWFSGSLVIATPTTSAKKMIASMSPSTIARTGLVGINRKMISAMLLGVSSSGSSCEIEPVRSAPTPGRMRLTRTSPVTIASRLVVT